VYLYLRRSTFYNNTIRDNSAGSFGGGFYLAGNDSTLTSNTVQGNHAGSRGGGLVVHNSEATLRDNTIAENTAVQKGGGIYLYDNAPILTGNTIRGNSSKDRGGGLYLERVYGEVTNNFITDNRSLTQGSGLHIERATFPLKHNTIARNSGGDGSGICITGSDSTVTIRNNILVSHTIGIDVQDGRAYLEATLWGTGTWSNGSDWVGAGIIVTGEVNIWGAPDFVDPDSGNYHLGPGSGALDEGVNAWVRVDIDHQHRPYQAPDLGADEYWPPGVLKHIYLPLLLKNP
jgi:parallel beta-helix repeat protein